MAMIARMRHRIGAETVAEAFSLRLITADAVCQVHGPISRTVQRFEFIRGRVSGSRHIHPQSRERCDHAP
jgi:hypothetical protein